MTPLSEDEIAAITERLATRFAFAVMAARETVTHIELYAYFRSVLREVLTENARAQKATIEALTAERDKLLGMFASVHEQAETLRNTLAQADAVIAEYDTRPDWSVLPMEDFRRCRLDAIKRHRSRLTAAPETD